MYEFEHHPPESEDDENDEPPPPSRRRAARPETWKRNNRPKKQIVSEKVLGVLPFFARTYLASLKGPCGCRMRCFTKLGRRKRKEIRKAFQSLPNRAKKQNHLKGLIELRQTVFKGKALEVHRKRKPRTFSATYFLKSPSDHKRVHVCLKAFLQILVSPPSCVCAHL